MFTFKKSNATGLSDEEVKMAQELNDAIAKKQEDGVVFAALHLKGFSIRNSL